MSRKSRRPGTSSPEVRQLEDRSVPATLSGIVYADINGNSIHDAGEPGMTGVTVQLDLGADGKVDATTVSGAGGVYALANVPDGTHNVVIVPPSGTVAPNNGTRTTTVTGNANVSGLFIPVRPTGGLSGVIFADMNGNGSRDASEPGIPNSVVNVDLFSDGTNELVTTTDTNGAFNFATVPDGTHKITATGPTNYTPVGENPLTTIVNGGSQVSGLNVGFRPVTAVGGTVRLASSPAAPGVSNVTVQLDANSDGKIDAVTATDAAGNYLFANVPSGTHTISVAAPAGSTFDTPTKTNVQVVQVVNQVKGGVDFGINFPGSVAGNLYLDANSNSVRDAGEFGLPATNVQVDLNNSGMLVTVLSKIGEDGAFTVPGLPDGTHTLVLTPPGGYASAGSTRAGFTIANGSVATIDAMGVQPISGSKVAISNNGGAGTVVYSFAPGPNGTLLPIQDKSVTTTARPGARSVTGDFNGDGVDDLIVANAPGEAPFIRIFDGRTGVDLVPSGILAFEPSFIGGIELATGDFNRDGKADIVVSAGFGGGPRVRIFDAAQFQTGADPVRSKLFADFYGIDDPAFRGGSRTAVGDLNGDGVADLIVAAGQGGGPRVSVYDGNTIAAGNPGVRPTHMIPDFFAFEQGLRNGAVVGVGDVNADGRMDLVTAAGPGGAPRVAIFSGPSVMQAQGENSTRIADFFVEGNTSGRAGTRITVKDVDFDGKADVITTAGSRAVVYTGQSLLAYYLNPVGSPVPAAEIVPFGVNTTLNLG